MIGEQLLFWIWKTETDRCLGSDEAAVCIE